MAQFEYTTGDAMSVLNALHSREGGLNDAEVTARRAEYGANALSAKTFNPFHILVRQFASPFIYVLLFAAILSLILKQYSDGIIILIFIVVNAVISFLQEYHSERAVLILNTYTVGRAKVRRNGGETVIPATELVPGDIVLVETGDVIPADLRFIETSGLSVNESILSGESVPVEKNNTALGHAALDIHSATNIGFSSSSVENGTGVGVVIGIGSKTALGTIATLTVETEHLSSFEHSIARFSKFILKMILVILVLLFVVNVAIKGTENLAELVIFSIALAISVIPEALPVVMTLSLSKGALRLAKQNVVVKRLSAVEDLGGIEILCTDKTGTLTENTLSVSSINAADTTLCLRYAAIGSAFLDRGERQPNNAFDLAIWNKLAKSEQDSLSDYERLDELPFDPRTRTNTSRIREKKTGKEFAIIRGAPESLFALAKLSAAELAPLAEWIALEGKSGRRAFGIGIVEGKIPKSLASIKSGVSFLGLISFVDPIKQSTAQAISDAKALGVTVKILTGDGPEVAGSVARQVGIAASSSDVILGTAFEEASPEEQERLAVRYNVFARTSPEQKYRIIEVLEKHATVGFLGEGINDAPALKIAGVGLVVQSASDIARDAADVVLLDSSLQVIVDGIKSGREIFENTIKYLKATLISNFGNFYAVATAALLIPYLPMLPMQILLLNLLSDFPMIAIATDTVDPAEVKNPKSYNVRDIVLLSIVLGLLSTVFDFIFFALFYKHDPAILQTNWFIGSVLTELALIYAIRTRGICWNACKPSQMLSLLSVIAALVTVALPYTYFGQHILKFHPPTLAHLVLIIGIVILYFISTEILKFAYYKMTNHAPHMPAVKHRRIQSAHS